MGREMSLEQLYCSDSQRRISYKSNPLLECPEIRKAWRSSRQCPWLSKSQKGRESPGENLGVKHWWSGLGDNAKKWIFESTCFHLNECWTGPVSGQHRFMAHLMTYDIRLHGKCAVVPDVWQDDKEFWSGVCPTTIHVGHRVSILHLAKTNNTSKCGFGFLGSFLANLVNDRLIQGVFCFTVNLWFWRLGLESVHVHNNLPRQKVEYLVSWREFGWGSCFLSPRQAVNPYQSTVGGSHST